MTKTNIPALVLGGGPTALAMIRCLGRKGITVYSAGHREGLVQKSRYFKPLAGIDPTEVTAGNTKELLKQLTFPKLVLIPCSDNWVEALVDPSLDLSNRFYISLPAQSAIEKVIDKKSLAITMQELSLPHPKSIYIDSVEDIEQLYEFKPKEWFLKPCDSQQFHRKYGTKAFSVDSKSEAIDLFNITKQENIKMLLQEYIPGDADNHYYVEGFVDRFGDIKAWFARRRIRMFPPRYGNSSYMVTIAHEKIQPAVDTTKALLKHLSYRGVFSIEFKYSKEKDKYYLIELNARPWWYIEVPFLCGIDFPMMIYKDALGIDIDEQSSYLIGQEFYSPYFDVSACQEKLRDNSLSYIDWINSWLKAKQVFFRWDDPYPTIHRLFTLGKQKIVRKKTTEASNEQ